MYSQLFEYLILYRELQIPGIGTFQIKREPARLDFPNRVIEAPVYMISLDPSTESISRHLFTWLSEFLKISDRDAVVRFNDFAFNARKQLQAGAVINWKGIGRLSKDLAGAIRLEPEQVNFDFDKPVAAEKVLRENAGHMIRVGEDERTSMQMTEILARPESRTSYWWAYALAVGIITIIFIGWYLSRHGVDAYSISNKQALPIKENTSTYRLLDN